MSRWGIGLKQKLHVIVYLSTVEVSVEPVAVMPVLCTVMHHRDSTQASVAARLGDGGQRAEGVPGMVRARKKLGETGVADSSRDNVPGGGMTVQYREHGAIKKKTAPYLTKKMRLSSHRRCPFRRNSPPLLLCVAGMEVGVWVALGYFTQAIGLQTSDASVCAFLCSLTVVSDGRKGLSS